MDAKSAIACQVPFVALNRQIASIRQEVEAAFATTLDEADFIGGAAVREFESLFSTFCQTAGSVGVANGTDALALALVALGLPRGGEVITTPNTFIATVEAIHNAGLKPAFTDPDPATRLMEPTRLEAAITPNTVAIIPVHLYGAVTPMDGILEIAGRHSLPVIEDACQAHGAEYNGRRAGSFGVAAAFSFYPAKNLGCFGDGGAVGSNDPDFLDRVRMISCHGSRTKYLHERSGYNSRLDTLQARILSVLLPHVNEWNQKRRSIAALYNSAFTDCTSIRTPMTRPGFLDIYHLYVIETKNRDVCRNFLAARGIGTGIHYPYPVYTTPDFAVADSAHRFPVAERLCREVLSLPMHPFLTCEELDATIETVQTWDQENH